jgi:hypothetical protein
MLDLTEMYIAMYPAKLEHNAPSRKPAAVSTPSQGFIGLRIAIASKIVKINAMTLMVLYCRQRYVSAPILIAEAISCIRFVP